jgi:hypothetical protein
MRDISDFKLDDESCGHPTTSETDPNVKKATEMIGNCCRSTAQRIAEVLNMNRGTVRLIFVKNLNITNAIIELIDEIFFHII